MQLHTTRIMTGCCFHSQMVRDGLKITRMHQNTDAFRIELRSPSRRHAVEQQIQSLCVGGIAHPAWIEGTLECRPDQVPLFLVGAGRSTGWRQAEAISFVAYHRRNGRGEQNMGYLEGQRRGI